MREVVRAPPDQKMSRRICAYLAGKVWKLREKRPLTMRFTLI